MPTSLRSEKIHSSNKEYSVDVVPSVPRDEDELPIRPTDPKVLRRATLKIDLYFIPIIGTFCELCLLYCPLLIAHLAHSKIFCPIW